MKKVKKIKAWAIVRKTKIETEVIITLNSLSIPVCMIFKTLKSAEKWVNQWRNAKSFRIITCEITLNL